MMAKFKQVFICLPTSVEHQLSKQTSILVYRFAGPLHVLRENQKKILHYDGMMVVRAHIAAQDVSRRKR